MARLRPLSTASGHWFRPDELVDLAAFLLPCLVYGWDASRCACQPGVSLAFISHDEFWCVATRDPEVHARTQDELKNLNPFIDEAKKDRFCRLRKIGR